MAKAKKNPFKWKKTSMNSLAVAEYSIETIRSDGWSSSWFIRRFKKQKSWCLQIGDQTIDRFDSLRKAQKLAKLVFETLNHRPSTQPL